MKEQNTQQEKKLGRGLSALLGESRFKKEEISPKISQELVESISLNKITAGIYQPRRHFNDNELEELSVSIKENGLIQPIILRKTGDEDHYEIIAGERRFRASKIAGFKTISAIVKKINNHEALELAIIENVQRSDLSLIEEAAGYKQLLEEFSYTQEQVGKKVGKSRSHITNLLRLLNLPSNVQDLLDQKLISMGHARAIINSDDPEKISQKIMNNSLSVRETEDLVRDEKIEKAEKKTLLVRTESEIKFVNSEYLSKVEKEFSEVTNMDVKIGYNPLKNKGKVTIKFSELEEIQQLIENIKD